MRQVSKKEFYEFINPLDVVGVITNDKWPYTTSMQTRGRIEVGRIVESFKNPPRRYPTFRNYYLSK